MDSLREELVTHMKNNSALNLHNLPFIIEFYSFDPLFFTLQSIFSNNRHYSRTVRLLAGYEFVRINSGKKIYLQNRSALLTPENLIAMTFFRIRESILQSKDIQSRSGNSQYFPDYVSLREIFEQDYMLLEDLLLNPSVTFTSSCFLNGVTGATGIYKIGEFDIEVKALSEEDANLTVARAERKHVVSKERVIFTEKQVLWDDDAIKDDFLELVAIFDMLNPDDLVFLHTPKVKMDLLTLAKDEKSVDFFDNARIKGLAQAQKDSVIIGRKLFNLSERLSDAQRLWHMIHSLNEKDKDRIYSAIRRYSIGALRNNLTDSTVDFAVALETLLLEHGSYPEISYRLKLRAGILTAKSEETPEIVKNLYDRRSRALHDNAKFEEDSIEFLGKVRRVLSEIFMEVIRISSSSRDKSVLSYLDNAIVTRGKENLTKNEQFAYPKKK